MIKIKFLVFALFISISAFTQHVTSENVFSTIEIYPNNKSAKDFKGTPLEVKLETYDFLKDQEKLKGTLIWKFNEKGLLIEFTNHNKKEKSLFYEYQDTLLTKIIKYDNQTNTRYIQTEYIYNEFGSIEKKINFNTDKDTTGKEIYYYKKQKERYPYKIEKHSSIYSANGFEKLVYKGLIKLEYDSEYNIVKILNFDNKNRFENARIFKYVSNHLVYEGISISENLSINTSYEYIRNSKHQILKRFETSGGKRELDYINTYLEDNLIRRDYYTKNKNDLKKSGYEEFKYNQNGEIIYESKIIYAWGIDKNSVYEIKYDSMLNILQKKITKTGSTPYQLKYTYTYR